MTGFCSKSLSSFTTALTNYQNQNQGTHRLWNQHKPIKISERHYILTITRWKTESDNCPGTPLVPNLPALPSSDYFYCPRHYYSNASNLLTWSSSGSNLYTEEPWCPCKTSFYWHPEKGYLIPVLCATACHFANSSQLDSAWMQWNCCHGKHSVFLESMWKHMLEALIKLPWHLLGTYYSCSVAFITSTLEEKTTPSINWHFNSVHKLYCDSHIQPTCHLG